MPEYDGWLQRISILEHHRPLTSLDDYLNDAHTRPVPGMPSAIHTRPSTVPRAHGKRSASDSKSPPTTGATKPVDTGHIYTDPDSTVEYLLPTPVRAQLPRGPQGGVPNSIN